MSESPTIIYHFDKPWISEQMSECPNVRWPQYLH